MAETKYGKHIVYDLIKDIAHYTGYSIVAHNGEFGTDCSMGYHCISKPISFDKPHAHDYTKLLCFIGGDPTDITDFGAEVKFFLGEEQEKHIINKTAFVSIPAGLVHGPINITRVEKPIVFLGIPLTRRVTLS